jgi:CubicO group peptidase (beta-lactamase class C family)
MVFMKLSLMLQVYSAIFHSCQHEVLTERNSVDLMMRMKVCRYILWLVLLLALILTLGCSDPLVTPEEWSAAAEQGMDAVLLQELVAEVEAGTYGEVRSLVIYRNDVPVVEEYFRGYDRDQRHHLFSVTKSFVSALTGIAIGQGHIPDVDVRLVDYFPEYSVSPGKENITLEHLLTMTPGFAWDEFSFSFSDIRNSVIALYNSGGWLDFLLNLPMNAAPGVKTNYNSGASILLGAIVTRATGMSLEDYAAEFLFGPLGITDWEWDEFKPGYNIGGWGLYLRPVDMAKLGLLYLHGGQWEGQQVVPVAWVATSTSNLTRMGSTTDYGYQWWRYNDAKVAKFSPSPEVNDIFMAIGRGDQWVWVIPHLNMVAACTAWNDDNGEDVAPILWEYLLRSVVD